MQYLAGFLSAFIQQYCSIKNSLGYDSMMQSCPCDESADTPMLNIMWVSSTKGGRVNHVVPVVEANQISKYIVSKISAILL